MPLEKRPNQPHERAVNKALTQGSPEWFASRKGKLTASRIGEIMPGKRGAYSVKREQLSDEMFDEILGEDVEAKDIPYTLQQAFDWGNNTEPKARFAYQLETGKLVREVGLFDHPNENFPYRHLAASPDGVLVMDPIGLEIKCPWGRKNHDKLLELVVQGVPTEDPGYIARISEDYRWQMFLQMECVELESVDFVSFDPRRHEREQIIVIPFQRDQGLIDKMYEEAEKFLMELHQRVQQRQEFRNGTKI